MRYPILIILLFLILLFPALLYDNRSINQSIKNDEDSYSFNSKKPNSGSLPTFSVIQSEKTKSEPVNVSEIEFDSIFENQQEKISFSGRGWIGKRILVKTNVSLDVLDLLFNITNSLIIIAPDRDTTASIETRSKAGIFILNSTIINQSPLKRNSQALNFTNAIDITIINSSFINYSNIGSEAFIILSDSSRLVIKNSIFDSDTGIALETNDIKTIEFNGTCCEKINATQGVFNFKNGRELMILENRITSEFMFNISQFNQVKIATNVFLQQANISFYNIKEILFQRNSFLHAFSELTNSIYIKTSGIISETIFTLNDFFTIIQPNQFPDFIGFTNARITFSYNYYNLSYSTDVDDNGIADQTFFLDRHPLYYESKNYEELDDGQVIKLKSIYRLQTNQRNLDDVAPRISLGVPALVFTLLFGGLLLYTLVIIFSQKKKGKFSHK